MKQDWDRILIKAAEKGDVTSISEAISNGVDVDTKDHNGNTALILAALYGNSDCVECLISAGVDLNTKDNNGNTALILAALYDESDCVKHIIIAGASVEGMSHQYKERYRDIINVEKKNKKTNVDNSSLIWPDPITTKRGAKVRNRP
jgi:ankyrin repeat protein